MYQIPSKPMKMTNRSRLSGNAFATTNESDYHYTQDELYQKYRQLSFADRIEYEERCSHAGIMLNLFDDFIQEDYSDSTITASKKKSKLVERITPYIFSSDEEGKDVHEPCSICHKKILGKEFSIESKACCKRKVHSDCFITYMCNNEDEDRSNYCPSCNVYMFTEEYLEKCKKNY